MNNMESTPDRYGFLHGLRILDLADEKASFCTRLLADMGARVIKVEKPGGDVSRNIGPFFKDKSRSKNSIPFFYNNINKLAITLDLEQDKGQSVFSKLVADTDVVVHTFAPDDQIRLGLDYEALSSLNPKLILASVTGFGQNEPRRDFKTSDLVASAYGGQMYVSGSPAAPPLKSCGDQSYYAASLFAATAILLALRNRAKTGTGEHLDISLQASVTATLEHVMVRYFTEGIIFQRQESLHWNEGFVILPCQDGFIHVTLFQKWETLIEWLATEGMAEDLVDEKWLDEDYRHNHLGHVISVLEKWTTAHRVDEILELAQSMRFPWAPVRTPNDVINCPQLKARHFFIEREEAGSGKTVSIPGLPYKTSGKIDVRDNPAPQPGEHNEMIYRQELGLSEKNLKWLYDNHVI
jgi:crotonobetainyl-CoA:carnitine CoA-transferase CaiB-like acyl-CoA transferase